MNSIKRLVSLLAIFILSTESFHVFNYSINSKLKSRSSQRTHLVPCDIPCEISPFSIIQNRFLLSDETIGYSSLSLYFTLALYVITLPGLYSLVTRSVKTTATQRIFDMPGPANPTAKPLRQTAAEFMAYFKALNYEVAAAEDVITFKGVLGQSKSQAAFLTFCTFMGLGSIALVLSILLPEVGEKAYALTLLSPYAGIFYWNNAQRVEEVQLKMETSDDDQTTSVSVRGSKEEIDRLAKTLSLSERGKVYVKGIFEASSDSDNTPQSQTFVSASSISGGGSAPDSAVTPPTATGSNASSE